MSKRLDQIAKPLSHIKLQSDRQIDGNMTESEKDQLYNLIYPQRLQEGIREVLSIVFQQKNTAEMMKKLNKRQMSFEQQRKFGMQVCLKVLKKMRLDVQKNSGRYQGAYLGLCAANLGIGAKTFLQYMLYIRALLIFQNNPYHRYLINRANNVQDLGCFALTEMDHGSYAKGINTQAKYQHDKAKFVITTHGEKGMKYWIGNCAFVANMCILWAQLVIDNKSYGPHPFVIAIRDSKTHQVLKGITIGDCGLKNGINCIDNGYIIIDQIEAPKEALLGKLGNINVQGKYVSHIKSDTARLGLHMSPLSTGRVLNGNVLSMAIQALYITLSQRKDKNSVIFHRKMVRNLSKTICYLIGGFKIAGLYFQKAKNLADPRNPLISEMHAISAVLKSKTSWFVSQVIEDCLQFLPSNPILRTLHHQNDLNQTWQGDNNILLQQTAKFLIKFISSPDSKLQLIDLNFLKEEQPISSEQKQLKVFDEDYLRYCLKNMMKQKMRNLSSKMIKIHQVDSEQKDDLWNQIQPHFCKQIALTFGDLYHFDSTSVHIGLRNTVMPAKTINILKECLKIWCLQTFLEQKYGNREFRAKIQNQIEKKTEQIFPLTLKILQGLNPLLRIREHYDLY